MSTPYLVLQQTVQYKWEDTQFIEREDTSTLLKLQAVAKIITKDTGRTTRIIRRIEEELENLTAAELRKV